MFEPASTPALFLSNESHLTLLIRCASAAAMYWASVLLEYCSSCTVFLSLTSLSLCDFRRFLSIQPAVADSIHLFAQGIRDPNMPYVSSHTCVQRQLVAQSTSISGAVNLYIDSVREFGTFESTYFIGRKGRVQWSRNGRPTCLVFERNERWKNA
jgi:hypothetical protein